MSTMMVGLGNRPDFQGGQPRGETAEQISQPSGDNPQGESPEQGLFSLSGLAPEDIKTLIDIITQYRTSWAQDRLERLRQWMENVFYWKGIQVIRWDSATGGWYDALAWARSQDRDDGEDANLERWINPLTLMFSNVFTGTMGRVVPNLVVKPTNADPNLKDQVTAKSAQEAIGIIERKNCMRRKIRSLWEMMFLFGCYFRQTRAVIDGEMFGYDDEQIFEDMEISMPAHYHCPKCGADTPVTATAPGSMGTVCPGCGAFMGQECYYGAGEGNRMSMRSAGVKKSPRAGVKWSIHSPLEIDTDPKAKGEDPLKQVPILAKDTEIDIGEARRMFPQMFPQIQSGSSATTTPNAESEKLARLNAVSALGGMTADSTLDNPTYSEVWMQPNSFYKTGDQAFGQRIEAKFPEGLKISLLGDKAADVRAACLTREWSHAALYSNQGVYCAALANTAVSFNARFNRVMWILDDWAARASTGLNFFNSAVVDTEKMSGKPVPAGTGISVPMRVNGQQITMDQIMEHFDLPVNLKLWDYPMMLLTFLELIIGIPRQLAGAGTQDDVETLGGQQLQLARAATVVKPYFEAVKDEHAKACHNAFLCLQSLMKAGAVSKIWEVIENRGGAFENNEVSWQDMQGNVEIEADPDQDLPVSPEELRAAIEMMWKSAEGGNQLAVEWWNLPDNQDMALSLMLPGTAKPSEPQVLKTLSDIQAIIEAGGMKVVMSTDGAQAMALPVTPDRQENFPLAKSVVQRFTLEHFELRASRPQVYQALLAYWDKLDDLDAAVAAKTAQRQMIVQQAAQPPQKASAGDQQMQAEMAQLMQVAGPAIMRLAQIMQMDPALTKGTANAQVSAAKEVVDTTVDAAKLAIKSK